MQEKYSIHEAAKEIGVEPHVLRYWEEELGLVIKRNEQGHRAYEEEQVEDFKKIKYLKEQGFQLKAIKNMKEYEGFSDLEQGNLKVINPFSQKQYTKIKKEPTMIEIKEKKMPTMVHLKNEIKMQETDKNKEEQIEKMARMQFLLQKIIKNAIEDNNNTLINEITENIKTNLTKELDYQFRELGEENSKRENSYYTKQLELQEEHYKKVDMLLRAYTEKKKKKFFVEK